MDGTTNQELPPITKNFRKIRKEFKPHHNKASEILTSSGIPNKTPENNLSSPFQQARYKFARESYLAEKYTIFDPLMKVFRREVILKKLEETIAHSKRTKEPLTIAMLDLDLFKKFNDQYGHQTGDKILETWAGFLKEELRETDLIGRYGGEEVIIILPNTNEKGGYTLLNRLRQKMPEVMRNSLKETISDSETVTMSVGTAQLQQKDYEKGNIEETAKSLIGKADIGMYEAKNSGRNKVCLSQGEL